MVWNLAITSYRELLQTHYICTKTIKNNYTIFRYLNNSRYLRFLRGVTLIFLCNLFSRYQLPSKPGPMTELLRGSWALTANRCLRCSHAHISYNFGSIIPNHLNMLVASVEWSLELVYKISSRLNKNGRFMSQNPYSHIWAYAPNLIVVGP